ncbi:hypothetical protein PFISCL1PPCAC_8500, partial [Pristionchus fissidentatus]
LFQPLAVGVVSTTAVATTAIANAYRSKQEAITEKHRYNTEQVISERREKEIDGDIEMKKLDNARLACESDQKIRTQEAVEKAKKELEENFNEKMKEKRKAYKEEMTRTASSREIDKERLKSKYEEEIKELKNTRDADLKKLKEELRMLKIENKEADEAAQQHFRKQEEEKSLLRDENYTNMMAVSVTSKMDDVSGNQQVKINSLREKSIPLKTAHDKLIKKAKFSGTEGINNEVRELLIEQVTSVLREIDNCVMALLNSPYKCHFPLRIQEENNILIVRLNDHLKLYENSLNSFNGKVENESTRTMVQQLEVVMEDLKGFPDAQTRKHTDERIQNFTLKQIRRLETIESRSVQVHNLQSLEDGVEHPSPP